MAQRAARLFVWFLVSGFVAACGGGGAGDGAPQEVDTPIPLQDAPRLIGVDRAVGAEGVPDGAHVTFVGDSVTLLGEGFSEDTRVFLGLDIGLANAEDGLNTLDAVDLPLDPFVYTDPDSGQETILEVEAEVGFVSESEIRITIPAAVACHAGFTNPYVRVADDTESGLPERDILYVVGPTILGLTPNHGTDLGGYSVTIHGERLSAFTQVAVRVTDPDTGATRTVGDTVGTDIEEIFVNENTLLVPSWPAAVEGASGLSSEVPADVLLFESIDAINGSLLLEPDLGGDAPCDALRPESPAAPLEEEGVRNSTRNDAFTYLPTGVTGFPVVSGVTPGRGPALGGNTVVVTGEQFDAFTVDLSDPDDPGFAVECPPGSGTYVPVLDATLVDSRTVIVTMPACAVATSTRVDVCLKNRFSVENPGARPSAGPSDTCVVFEDLYAYEPVAPVTAPSATAVFPDTADGDLHDFGLERFFLLGAGFDDVTAAPEGVAFVLPGGEVVPALRVVARGPNLLEVFTRRLPAAVYPLASDLAAALRLRNHAGETVLDDFVTFRATADAGAAPTLSSIVEPDGPIQGGNRIVVEGANFDTSTTVLFGALEATDVQFVDSRTLLVTVPPVTEPQTVDVVADDGDLSNALSYSYVANPGTRCVVLAALEGDAGAPGGGYSVLAYGAQMTPSTRIAFGGNLAPETTFIGDTLLRVTVPAALAGQIGATIDVGATDPARGCTVALRTVPFTYATATAPGILAVATSVDAPGSDPALRTPGGDLAAVLGSGFDAATTFTLDQGGSVADALGIEVLAPGFALFVAPPAPDGAGPADLVAHGPGGDSDAFVMEYVTPSAPTIADVRGLADAGRTAPVDAGSRLVLFGTGFFAPLTVSVTGCDVSDPETTTTVEATRVTLLGDTIAGVTIPADVFCEGPLSIEVETPFGTATFDAEGDDAFTLVGPAAPIVDAVFPPVFVSSGGEEAILVGRFFTPTTVFRMGTEGMTPDEFRPVLATRIASDSVAVVTMPALPGGLPPAGLPGFVRAEESDADRAAAIVGDPFTVSGELFRVVREGVAALLGVFPDQGFIEGGEAVLLLGNGFLTTFGGANVTDIRFVDPVLGDVGDYVEASLGDLPLGSEDRGKYFILNDQEILIITNERPPVPNDLPAPVDVIVESTLGDSVLRGGFTYLNSPAVRTPMLLAITPNETRLNGGSTHLLSGGFLTEADRIVLVRPADGAELTLDVDSDAFAEVNDSFLVFTMPDLRGTFEEEDVLDLRAEKDLPDGSVRVSNTLRQVLEVTFAGPPVITTSLSPNVGGAFGGTVVEITGEFFTTNSQVLFGTLPARHVVFVDPMRILAIAPTLPVDVPDPGLDLRNLHEKSGTVDVALFTQGGWAVLDDGYTFQPEAPVVGSCSPDVLVEGAAARITLLGDNFVPGSTTVTAESGTVSNVVVEAFDRLSFDYEAPTYPRGTLGPKTDLVSVATNQGEAEHVCEITIKVNPFVDACETSYSLNDHASPSTGVDGTQFVEVTVTGGNFETGGSLTLVARTGDPIPLTGIDAAAAFSLPGQFKVVDARTIVFTPPNRFPSDTPTLLDGNPNIGPVDITYTSLEGREDTLVDCFFYIPSIIDFDDLSFSVPNTAGDVSFLDRIVTGDINADGMPDVVAMARQTSPGNDTGNAEAYVLIADTFGPLDINADGNTPDFAGTFTRHVVSDDRVRTWLEKDGRGARPILANLDGDDSLEIVIPVVGGLLLVDVTAAGELEEPRLLEPSALGSNARISGIASGDFDDGHDGPDLALTAGGSIILLKSTATAFSFAETSISIAAGLDSPGIGFLEAGDFDGDGDDDLIWGQTKGSTGGSGRRDDLVIAVAEVDGGTVVSQKALTNLTGGRVGTIVTGDLDGDGDDDAIVLVQDEANGSLVGDTTVPGGFAVLLDPLGLEADSYTETAFRQNTSAPYEGSGVYAVLADANADGHPDVAVASEDGEIQLFLGDGAGGFEEVGRTWALNSRTGPFDVVLHGLGAADFNHDGMAELLVGDVGVTPTSLVLWLNISR